MPKISSVDRYYMNMKWSLIFNSLVCYTLNPKSGICFQFSRKRKLWSATIIIIISSSCCSSSSSVISCKKIISSNSVNKGFGAWLLNFSSFEEKNKLQTQFSNCFIRYFFFILLSRAIFLLISYSLNDLIIFRKLGNILLDSVINLEPIDIVKCFSLEGEAKFNVSYFIKFSGKI